MPLNIIREDITKMKVDAIVNTTNYEMVGYSGVDLAIHSGAGSRLDSECKKLAPLELGTAKITKGYNLDCKYIIHTSGPVWQGGVYRESEILKSCYLESLKMALSHNCETVAFPLISSGAYGFPKDMVLKFAIQVITEFLLDHELTVYICVFDKTSYEFSRKMFAEIKEYIDDDYVNEKQEMFFETSTLKSFSICAKEASPRGNIEEIDDNSLKAYMKKKDKSFAYKLFDLIDERGFTDVECYKKANVDKKTFSKMKCNPETYKPSKQTAVAFAIALKLNFAETQELLAAAGLTLSESFVFDKIIRYFLEKEIYDIFEINEALFEFDQVLLGC